MNPADTAPPTTRPRSTAATGPGRSSSARLEPRYSPRYAGSMANPQGLTAEAIPAAKANSAVPPIRPPRNSCEFPDSFPSTNRLIGSIPPPLPTAIAPATATASATTATTPVTAQVRPCPSLSADSAAFITLIRPNPAGRICFCPNQDRTYAVQHRSARPHTRHSRAGGNPNPRRQSIELPNSDRCC